MPEEVEAFANISPIVAKFAATLWRTEDQATRIAELEALLREKERSIVSLTEALKAAQSPIGRQFVVAVLANVVGGVMTAGILAGMFFLGGPPLADAIGGLTEQIGTPDGEPPIPPDLPPIFDA